MPNEILSNEDKTLEEIINPADPRAPLEHATVSEETRGLLAGAMITGGIAELRIDDKWLKNRAQIEVKRDIFKRQTVLKLVGAEHR